MSKYDVFQIMLFSPYLDGLTVTGGADGICSDVFSLRFAPMNLDFSALGGSQDLDTLAHIRLHLSG